MGQQRSQSSAFTRAELLALVVCLSLIGILAVPTLAAPKRNSGLLRCKANMAALTQGWLLYAEDNNGKLVPNNVARPSWVEGVVTQLPAATNLNNIRNGLIWPYLRDLSIYQCPDEPRLPGGQIRARTVSMSWRMNGDPAGQFTNPTISPWKSLNTIRRPDPAGALVFVDEYTDPVAANCSLDDGIFVVRADGPNNGFWQNIPASRHGSVGVVSLADGHVEVWRWVEATTPRLKGLDKTTRSGDRDLERFRRATIER